MKLIRKILIPTFILMSVSSFSQADDRSRQGVEGELRDLKKEVRQLRRDIARLEQLIVDNASSNPEFTGIDPNKRWGCYMDDWIAGAAHGTGATEAEAKGVTLEQCNIKKGSCKAKDLVCSQSES